MCMMLLGIRWGLCFLFLSGCFLLATDTPQYHLPELRGRHRRAPVRSSEPTPVKCAVLSLREFHGARRGRHRLFSDRFGREKTVSVAIGLDGCQRTKRQRSEEGGQRLKQIQGLGSAPEEWITLRELCISSCLKGLD